MATLLAMKQLLLCLALALGGPSCAGGPDELELLYGHTFAGDSRLGEHGGGGWPISNEDSDFVGVGLVWKLKPTRVEVVNPVVPPVRWTLEPTAAPVLAPQDPPAGDPPAQDPPAADPPADPPAEDEEHPTAASHVQQDLTDAAEAFDAMDWLTRVLLFLAVGWLGWVYRKQIGSWIPTRKKAPKGE